MWTLIILWPLIPAALCPTERQGDGVCDGACMTAASTYDTGPSAVSDCLGLCSTHCDSSLLTNSVCDESCNTWDCAWDGGLCTECAAACGIALLGDGTCHERCNVATCAWDFGDCSNQTAPLEIYVGGSQSGDGSAQNPFFNLTKTLGSLFVPYAAIHLLPGTYNLSADGSPLLTQWGLLETVITGPAVIQLTRRFAYFHLSHNVTFRDIRFLGSYGLFDACQSETCAYCPFLSQDYDNTWWNDKGQIVDTSLYAAQSYCDAYHTKVFIATNASLWLQNVTFEGFRQQLHALITTECGDLVLQNVSFTRCMSAFSDLSGGLVQHFCPANDAPYACGRITYTLGTVQLLNDGYEYQPNMSLSGFLSSQGILSLAIREVQFMYNSAIVGEAANGHSALISLTEFREIAISDCVFISNIAATGLIYVASSLVFPLIVSGNVASEQLLEHVVLTNVTFANNTVLNGSLIALSYADDHQNVRLTNVTISGSTVSESLLGLNNAVWKSEDAAGENRTVRGVTALYPRRYVEVDNFAAVDNLCQKVAHLRNVGNLALTNSRVLRNGESRNSQFPFSAAFANFVSSGNAYMTLQPVLSTPLTCEAGIALFTVLNLTFLSNTLSDNFCPNGTTGLSLAGQANVVQVRDCVFSGNTGSGALTMAIGQPLTLSRLRFVDNVNTLNRDSVCMNLLMTVPADVTIEDSAFEGNYGWISTVIFADNLLSLTLVRVQLLRNIARYDCAGVLFNPSRLVRSAIVAQDSLFVQNTAKGYGVIAVIDYYGILNGNTLGFVGLTVRNCSFVDNASGSLGASVTVGTYVDLSLDSIISNSYFHNNTSEAGGALHAAFQTGVLTIDECWFEGNRALTGAALYLAHAAPQNTVSGVHFRACVFRGQILGAAVHLQGLAGNINVTSFNNTYQDQARGVLLSAANLTDANSTYKGHYEREGPAINAKDYSILNLFGCVLTGNTAWGSGGAIFLTGHSNMTMIESVVAGNHASNRGGGLYLETISLGNVIRSTFRENTASVASAIFGVPAILYLTSSLIADNTVSTFGSLHLSQCTAVIESTVFRNNTSLSGGCPGLILSNCNVDISHSLLQDHYGKNGGFIQALDHNTVLVSFTRFERGHAALMGGAIYASTQTTIHLTGCLFEDCHSDQEAGVIEVQSGSLYISNTSFVQARAVTLGGVIALHQGTVAIENSRFETSYPSALYVVDAESVLVSSSVFLNSSSTGSGAIEATNVLYSLLQGNRFVRCNGTAGGAVQLLSSATREPRNQHTLIDNEFVGNEAYGGKGGAVYAAEVDIVLRGNSFTNNSADEGGAVATECVVQTWCNVTVQGNSFAGNAANTQGGAIKWSDVFPVLADNVYSANTAVYGADVASFPVKVAIVTDSGAAADALGTLFALPLVLRLFDVASGHLYTNILRFGLFDHNGELVRSDSSSQAQLTVLNSTLLAVSGAAMGESQGGIFALSQFALVAEPGSKQYLKLSTNGVNPALHAKAQDQATYWREVLIEVNFRKCVAGESDQSNQCFVCTAGTYSFDPTLPCRLCPSAAICYGNTTMVPKPGYWRMTNDTDVFIECLAAEACIGSPPPPLLSLTGLCAPGCGGNLCQQCQPGYTSSGRNMCSKCPNMASNATITTLICVFALVVLAIIVWTAVKSAQRPQSLIAVHVKIFMNYLQMVVVSAALNLNWPTFAKAFLSGQQMAGGVAEQLFSVDCLIENDDISQSLYFTKVTLYAVLPAALFILGMIAWLLIAVCTKVEHLVKKQAATAVIIIFILHPSVTKIMFSLFSCMNLGDSHSYLVNDLSIVCWNSDHLKEIFTVVLPAMIVIVFGLPLITMLILVHRRSSLESSEMKLMLCFLYKGYTRPRFYWEFVILYRKVAMIAASVFLAQVSIRVQALTVLAILLLSLFFQVQVSPFFDASLNRLEVKAILASAVTIYAGLYYNTDQMSASVNIALFCLMVLVNAYFLVSWLRVVSPVLIKTIREQLGRLVSWRRRYSVRSMGSAVSLDDHPDKSSNSVSYFPSDMTNPRISVDISPDIISIPPNTPNAILREGSEEAKDQTVYAIVR